MGDEEVKKDEEIPVVTMLDVLQDEKDMEENANAVLGAASETECSYASGYVPRQPLYACSTCSVPASPDFQAAGVCLACSYHCHEGHILVELYTKRDFRCDCGTLRLPSKCKLGGTKEQNTNNKYNQNFKGLYCTCSRPYPDPEDPVDDCMVQCVVCEDWYHGRHLGVDNLPNDRQYAEMVCQGCVALHPFLHNYKGLAVTQMTKEGEEVTNKEGEGTVQQSGEATRPEDCLDVVSGEGVTTEPEPAPKGPPNTSGTGVDSGMGRGDSVCIASAPCSTVPEDGAATTCSLPQSTSSGSPATLFLPSGWRAQLCRCNKCLQVYTKTGTSYLLQNSDTVHYYEAQAKETSGQFEKGMEALSKMDRIKQVEAIHSYNNMKENLMGYLAKFAEGKKVVREEDIKEFFEGMKSNKKLKVGGPPPANCK